MADIEIGEMLLNFMINKDMRNLCGFNVTHVRPYDPYMEVWDLGRVSNWEHWIREMMVIVPLDTTYVMG